MYIMPVSLPHPTPRGNPLSPTSHTVCLIFASRTTVVDRPYSMDQRQARLTGIGAKPPLLRRSTNAKDCPTADLRGYDKVRRARRNSVLHRYAPIAKHDVARLKCLGLQEIKSQAD